MILPGAVVVSSCRLVRRFSSAPAPDRRRDINATPCPRGRPGQLREVTGCETLQVLDCTMLCNVALQQSDSVVILRLPIIS